MEQRLAESPPKLQILCHVKEMEADFETNKLLMNIANVGSVSLVDQPSATLGFITNISIYATTNFKMIAVKYCDLSLKSEPRTG